MPPTFPRRTPARRYAAIAALALALTAGASGSARATAPVTSIRADVSLDPATNLLVVKGEVVLAEVPPGDAPWRFLLHRDLRVRGVSAGGKPVAVRELDGWDPRHFWERPPYADLGGYDVAREIEVGPPAGGWGDEPPRISLQWHGTVADSLHPPEKAYDRSFETTTGRIVQRGAFLSGATFWLPWSGPAPFTYQLSVEAPAEWSTILPGDFEGREERGERAVMHWASRDPVESVPLVSGPYVIERREHKGVSLETWCYASTPKEVSEPYLGAAAGAIDRFSERFGPYPYSKFALVENYWQTGWGMPSFTFLGDRVIRLPFIVYTSYPHEILHNWWGNGVFVDASGGNWCEGLTTYGADYAAKEAEGGTAARDYRRNQLIGYRDFAAAGGRDFPLTRFRERDSAATQAVGYGKTFMVFHMLRQRLGQGGFDGALRRFYRTNLFRSADWSDVREAFEEDTGEDLATWFDTWVGKPGAPTLALEGVVAEPHGDEWMVSGTVVQDGAWPLRVPVVVTGDGERAEQVLPVTGERTPFEMAVAFPPVHVAADPDFHIFRLLYAEEVAPTLSGVLGAKRTRIVIGTEVSGPARDELVELGEDWARDDEVVLVEEVDGEELPPFEGGTWFFGGGAAADAFVAELPEVPSAEGEGAGDALVLAGRIGGDEERPGGVFLPGSADAVAAIGRKIPHYSKYSWLAFEGARNVGKGTWDPGESPLTVRVEAES
jgi:hypothetical protein